MSKTLLLADDSLTIQRVVDLTFAQEDVRVVSFDTGDKAVKWMEGERPDIVLADVGMPQPDGYALALHVKHSPHLRNVPVLLLTGAFEPLDDERARESACDGVLVKPFEPQHLVARVAELLARPAPAVEPEAPAPAPRPESESATPHAKGNEGAEAPIPEAPASAPSSAPALHLVEPLTLPEVFDMSAFATDLAELDAELSAAKIPEVSQPADPEPEPLHAEEPLAIQWSVPLAAERAAEDTGEKHIEGEPMGLAPALDQIEPLEPFKPHEPLVSEPWDLAPPAHVAAPEFAPLPSPPVAAPAPPPAEPAPQPQSPVTLASAFSALLAAEQAHPPAAAEPAALSEAAIEDIVRRVLHRVTDDMVRQIVLDAAERMIKAEIDKIKDSPDE